MAPAAPTYEQQEAVSLGTFGSLAGFVPGGEKWSDFGK